MSVEENHDIIIVGAGPAGLTAAIYCSWLGRKTLVLEAKHHGGRASSAALIENFPGFEEGVKGPDLVEKMHRQAKRFGTNFRMPEEVVGFNLKNDPKRVITRKASYEGKAVIIGTGAQRKKLSVPGEAEFLGRGVSYCSICDGPFFRNLNVAVVGSNDEALSDASYLSGIARHVVLVAEPETKVSEHLLTKLLAKANFEVVRGQITAITGEKSVNLIKIREKERETLREVSGVFVSLGGVPMTEIVKNAGVTVDARGCIAVDRMQRTNIARVFAAGDCTCGGMQIVTATGEGAMAAMKAFALAGRTEE